MNTAVSSKTSEEMKQLCATVKDLIANGEYTRCFHMICHAMESYPDTPEPHNLLGILLEKQGNHAYAMRHFRAAYALDPDYSPAMQNLYNYGTFFGNGKCAYDDSDCSDNR